MIKSNNMDRKLDKCAAEAIVLRGTKDPLWTITANKYVDNNECHYKINERNAFITIENNKTVTLYTSKEDI